jgi:hypothetical protein
MQQNLISGAITDAEMAKITDAVTQITTVLKPILKNLTPAERQGMAKMGDKTLAFVGKAQEYSAQNPALNPSYLDVAEAKADFELAQKLETILKMLQPLAQSVEDTLMMAGSDAYLAALEFYFAVKGATRTNVPGSTTLYEDLKQRFPNRGRKKPADEVK